MPPISEQDVEQACLAWLAELARIGRRAARRARLLNRERGIPN